MKKCTYILAVAVLACFRLSATVVETSGNFKDWDYTPNHVYGQVKLQNVSGHQYYKIAPVDSSTTKVDQVNQFGITTSTRIVTFKNGLLNKIALTNQWGDNYENRNFESLGNDRFMVTVTRNGKNTLLPCKACIYVYQNDLLAEVQFVGFDNHLCNGANGVAIVRYKKYDDGDRFAFNKEQSFFDEEKSPVINKSGDCHTIVYERDARGNCISEAYYDEQDQPVATRYGSFKILSTYDTDENEINRKMTGLNGQVAANIHGVARTEREYTNGVCTKSTFYNAQNKVGKSLDAGSGVAISKFEYDERGNVTRISHFDEQGQRLNDHAGMQSIDYKYSADNMLISEEYFDNMGKPAVNRDSVHRYVFGRDEKGRLIAREFFNVNNEPTKNRLDRVYIIRLKYDSLGRELSESYWMNDKIRMPRWDGYFQLSFVYNEQGQETENDNLNQNGDMMVNQCGYSRTITIYNQSSRVSQVLRFNGDKPGTAMNGGVENYHCIKFTYDEKNRVSAMEYFDTLGHPTTAHIGLGPGYECCKIEVLYTGNKITAEKLYAVNSSYPKVTIDCLKSDYINTSGVSFGRKNK